MYWSVHSIWFRIIISEHLGIDVSCTCIMVHPVVLQLVTEKWHATRFVCRNFTFITHYHPKAEILQRIIRKYWHLIKNDPTIQKNVGAKFKKNLTIGFKRNRNIGETSHKINLIVPKGVASLFCSASNQTQNIFFWLDAKWCVLRCFHG